MKNNKALCGIGFLFTAVLAGCVTEPLMMGTSEKIPAAEAKVDVKKTDDNNTKIDLTVKHLATPEKVDPAATTYVVWTRATQDSPAQNMGALNVDKNLKAGLQTITPLKQFELFVTPESSPVVAAPTGESVLWTNVVRE